MDPAIQRIVSPENELILRLRWVQCVERGGELHGHMHPFGRP